MMPASSAEMYLVMLATWQKFARGDDLTFAEVAFSDYLDALWWNLSTDELIAVNETLRCAHDYMPPLW